MTVTSQLSSQTFPGNGARTAFAFSFNIPEAGDEQVFVTDAAGVITGPLASNLYTISGYGEDTGGTITYPLVGSPIPLGSTLTLARNLAEVQDTPFGNQGPLFPQAIEQALDYLTMLLQQTSNVQNRALTVPIVDPAPLPLPAAAARANQLLGFDTSGNPIAAQPSSALVSTAMQPVVAAATVALARTMLGLGALATEGIGAGLQDDGAGNARVNFVTYDDAISISPVPASYHLTRRDATGPITYTLARANTYWNGFGFWISAVGGGPITVAIDSHDAFEGRTAGASISIQVGEMAYITCDGEAAGSWYADIQGQTNVPQSVNPQTGSSYTIQSTDWGEMVTRTNAATIADVLPQATGAFSDGFWFRYQNIGQTFARLTPTVSTINGASSLLVPPGEGLLLVSSAGNWFAAGHTPSNSKTLLATYTATAGVTTALQDAAIFSNFPEFSEFEIVIEDYLGTTATAIAQLQVYAASAYQTSGYLTYVVLEDSGGAVGFNPSTYIPAGNPQANSIVKSTCRFSISNPNTAGKHPFTMHDGVDIIGSTYYAPMRGGGMWDTSGAITGFRLQPSTSTFGAATVVKVYGSK